MLKVNNVWCCDFCFKSSDEVIGLVATKENVAICNECVIVATQVLFELNTTEPEISPTPS